MSDRSNKKNKTRNDRKKKIRYIEPFANFYGIILRLFGESQKEYLYKNKICDLVREKKAERRTGLGDIDRPLEFQPYSLMGISNKEYCLEAINKLYDSQLLDDFDDTIDVTTQRKKKNRDTRQHKFTLSEKGKEIAKLLIEIDEYQKNYFKLEQGIGEKIPHKSRKEIKEMRRYDSGWKDKEIEFYFTYRSNALDLIDLIDKNFIGIVLVRYSKIIDDTFIMLNKDAKKILNDIIIKVFERRIRQVLDKYKIYEESAKARIIENYRNPIYQKPQYEAKYESGIQGRLPHFMDIVNFFNHKIIPQQVSEEVEQMILSYLRLVEFPNDKVSKESIKSFLQNKNFLTEDYIIQNKQKDSLCSSIEYDYEYLIKIRFDTQELFQKILLNYIN